jgi:similar to spore coat protein
MNTIVEHLTGMHTLTDQVIAMDYLISTKNGIINLATAITETATPEIRLVLRKQLEETIAAHGHITSYLMENLLYRPHDITAQVQLDIKNIDTALAIPKPS